MIIRVYEDKDADICDKLLEELIKDEKNYDKYMDEIVKVNNYFRNVIKNDNNILLAYKDNNEIKAYLYLKYKDNGYLIDGLYVKKEYRRQGIATLLIKEALYILKRKKAKYIDTNVFYNNKIAYKLYKSFGFDIFRVSLRKNFE